MDISCFLNNVVVSLLIYFTSMATTYSDNVKQNHEVFVIFCSRLMEPSACHTVSRGWQVAQSTDKISFVYPSDAGQQHHPSLLQAIYSEKTAAYASPSISVMKLDNGDIGCLASVCFSLHSEVLQHLSSSHQAAAVLWELAVGDQCFWAVALSLFWYCLMLQILTSWVFIVLCRFFSLLLAPKVNQDVCQPVCSNILKALCEMLPNVEN